MGMPPWVTMQREVTTVKVDNIQNWMTAFALFVAVLPAGIQAQDRAREREEDRTPGHRSTWIMPNMFVQNVSGARLGLYLDADQPRRYDDEGAWVRDVMRGSPAEDAGLRDGDIITAFDGEPLNRPLSDAALEQDLDPDRSLPAQRVLALAREVEPGQRVAITYTRDGESHTVEITAEEFDFPRVMSFGGSDGDWTVDIEDGPLGDDHFVFRGDEWAGDISERVRELTRRFGDRWGFSGDLGVLEHDCPGAVGHWGGNGSGCAAGVEFRTLNASLGEYFEADRGVLVIDVDEDAALGLLPGDVVIAVGGREVDDAARVRRLINSYEPDEPIRMTIIRKGDEQVVEGFVVRN